MGMKLKDLEKGDRVMISKHSDWFRKGDPSNPQYVEGTYILNGDLLWDNGSNNTYWDNDLILIKKNQKHMSYGFRNQSRRYS